MTCKYLKLNDFNLINFFLVSKHLLMTIAQNHPDSISTEIVVSQSITQLMKPSVTPNKQNAIHSGKKTTSNVNNGL